jgi:hypothetical protein
MTTAPPTRKANHTARYSSLKIAGCHNGRKKMKKQINLGSIKLLSMIAVVGVAIIVGANTPASSQGKQKFKVGDRIECDPSGGGYWHEGVVVPFKKNDMYNGYTPETGYFYRVKIEGYDMEALACKAENIRALVNTDADNNGGDNKVADDKANAEPEKKKANTETVKKNDVKPNQAAFKVGDRVLANPLSMDEEKYWWKCTITGIEGVKSNFYNVRCDPQGGRSYMDHHVQPAWVRPLNDGVAPPTFECSFDTPAGTASNAAAPSPQLFKRVIYERMAALEKAKLGVVFTTFQMGTPYKNLLTRNGLMDTAAPQNATIYPVKTEFRTCKEVTGDYNYLTVTKENFACFKDRFGAWVCGADSVPEFLEHQSVPKNQK